MGTAKLQLNSTQIPNIILDEWTPELSPAEFKVVMIIARQTYGWHKDIDRISYNQLQEKTGYKTDAIVAAIKSLRLSGKIIVTDSDGNQLHTKEECQGKTLYYQLNLSEKPRTTSRKNRDTKETNTKENMSTNVDIEPKALSVEKRVYGNTDINRILQEFSEITGLQKPSDKNPRFAAKNFLQSKLRRIEDFRPALDYFYNSKGYDLTSISAVTRHFSEYVRDIKEKYIKAAPQKLKHEFKGFDI